MHRLPHPDLRRAAFLDEIAGIQADDFSVMGEGLAARVVRLDCGVVSGIQVLKGRKLSGGRAGALVEDHGGFAHVFERRGGRWVLTMRSTCRCRPCPPRARARSRPRSARASSGSMYATARAALAVSARHAPAPSSLSAAAAISTVSLIP